MNTCHLLIFFLSLQCAFTISSIISAIYQTLKACPVLKCHYSTKNSDIYLVHEPSSHPPLINTYKIFYFLPFISTRTIYRFLTNIQPIHSFKAFTRIAEVFMLIQANWSLFHLCSEFGT